MGHEHDRVVAGLINERDLCKLREAVCIQTEKIYDSCRDKDCIEDARVYFRCPEAVQKIVNKSINVKIRRAEVLDVFTDVEPVPFKRGFYTVDVKFFIKVTLDFFVPKHGGGMPKVCTIPGLVVFDKKVILFGSEGNVKIFKSRFVEHGKDYPMPAKEQDNQPIAKVEVAEPIALNARIQEFIDKCVDDCCWDELPRNVVDMLGDEDINVEVEVDGVEDTRHHPHVFRRVVVSLGLFSIIKLARLVQLLIPAFNFCVPNKECVASTDENPCELFETIDFPVDEFFPPQKFDFPGAEETEKRMHENMGE